MSKSIFKAIWIALTVMFVIGCGQNGPSRPTDPLLKTPPGPISENEMGTSDQGGGGDVPAEKAVAAEEIIKMIETLKFSLPPALYRAELGIHGDVKTAKEFYKEQKHPEPEKAAQALISLMPKIYSNPTAKLYAALSDVEFVAKKDGPCQDLQHQDKDGSAFNINPKEICLSVPRLQARLTSHVAWSEILSLAAHELSHRAGATEEEAQAFQFLIKQQSGLSTAEAYRAYEWYLGSLGKLHWQFAARKGVFEAADPESISQLCSEIGQSKEYLENLFDRKLREISAVGLLFERPHTLRILQAAAVQSKFLTGFCGEAYYDIAEDFVIDRNLDPKKPFSFATTDVYHSNKEFLNISPAEGDLIIVKKHDWKAALYLYQQIERNINRYNDFVEHPEKSPLP